MSGKSSERLGEQEREIASLVKADHSLNTVLTNVQHNLADIKLRREPQDVLGQLGQVQRLNGQMEKLETKLNGDMKSILANLNQVVLGHASDVRHLLDRKVNLDHFKDQIEKLSQRIINIESSFKSKPAKKPKASVKSKKPRK